MKSDSQKLEEIRDVVSWATPPLVPTDEEQHWNEGMFDGLRKIKKILNESPSNQECDHKEKAVYCKKCNTLRGLKIGSGSVTLSVTEEDCSDCRPKKNNTKECENGVCECCGECNPCGKDRPCHCGDFIEDHPKFKGHPKKEERCTCIHGVGAPRTTDPACPEHGGKPAPKSLWPCYLVKDKCIGNKCPIHGEPKLPSERIKELALQQTSGNYICRPHESQSREDASAWVWGILDYLDEQHNQDQ